MTSIEELKDDLLQEYCIGKMTNDEFFEKLNQIELSKIDQLKAKHKEDVIKAYRHGEANMTKYLSCGENIDAEQYYNDNHKQNKE